MIGALYVGIHDINSAGDRVDGELREGVGTIATQCKITIDPSRCEHGNNYDWAKSLALVSGFAHDDANWGSGAVEPEAINGVIRANDHVCALSAATGDDQSRSGTKGSAIIEGTGE